MKQKMEKVDNLEARYSLLGKLPPSNVTLTERILVGEELKIAYGHLSSLIKLVKLVDEQIYQMEKGSKD